MKKSKLLRHYKIVLEKLNSHALLIKKLVTSPLQGHLRSRGNKNPGVGDVLSVSESD